MDKEKIKALLKQAYVPIVDRDSDNEYDMEKFAELLIKECRDVLLEAAGEYMGVGNRLYDYAEGLHDGAEVLKIHFGVQGVK